MSDWPQVRLGDLIVEAAYGTSVKCSETAEGIPVLRMCNVRYDGELDLKDLKYAPLSDADLARFGIQGGDILFNRTNSKEQVGKTGLWDGQFPAAAASYFIRVRVDCQVVCPRWVWRFMNSAAMKSCLFATARGAIGQANINSEELRSFSLPLPPLEDQRRIVGLLDRAAEIRRRADAARTKARAIIPALFLDMFGDPDALVQRHGARPFAELVNFKQLGLVRAARDQSEAGNVGYLRMNAITRDGRINMAGLKRTDVSAAELDAYELRKGDLLFNTRNSKELVGKMGLYDGPAGIIFNNNILRLRLVSAVNAAFVNCYFLTSPGRRAIEAIKKGTTSVFAVYFKDLGSVAVPVPPLPLQSAFAEQAQRIEATARALDAAAAKAEAMAAALSAEVFDRPPAQITDHAA